MNNLLRFGAVIGMLLIMTSCIKDYQFDKVKFGDWNPDIAAPLVSSRLTMDDLIENSEGYLFADPNTGRISIAYESQVSSGILEDFLEIPDQELNTTKDFFLPPFLPGDTFILAYGQDYPLDLPGGERLDSLKVNAAFSFQIQSDINHSGIIEINLPFIECEGQPLVITLDHNYTGTLPVLIDFEAELDGCVITTFSSGGIDNIINPQYKLTLYGDNEPNMGDYTIDMGESLIQVDFEEAYGWLGSREESLSDTIEIDAFNSVTFGDIRIDSVILEMDVYNSFGLPVRIIPSELWGFSAVNYPYKFPVDDLPDYFPVNSPGIADAGQYATSRIVVRSSDLAEMINNSPTKFYYDFSSILNPGGSQGGNFVLDTSKMDMDVRVEVPITGSVSALVLEDTVSFGLSDLEELESAGFRFRIENTFPMDVGLQVYMMDEANTVIDSMFNGYNLLIKSGPIGPEPDLKILSPGVEVSDVSLSGERIDNLLKTEKLVLKGRMSTTNSDRVVVYGDSYLDVKISANASLNVSLNE